MLPGLSVRDQLAADNEFFKKMINQIPTQFYFSRETQDVLAVQKENNEAKTKQGEKRKASLSVKAGKKRAKYDPSSLKTVTDIQQQLEQQDMDELTTVAMGWSNDRDALRESLREKVKELQAKRMKPGSVDSQELKRLKRKLSKQKLKKKRLAEKQVASTTPVANGKTKSPQTTKPIFNKDGKIVFSKFDFSDGVGGKKPAKSDQPTGKNYKQLLEKVKKQKEKIERAKGEDENKAKELKEKAVWKSAILKAEGVKVKDNAELLKKSLKRKEKQKVRSQKGWQEREEGLQQKMKDRQDKRTKNIQKKTQGRLDNKIKKAKKRGRVIPGF